MELAEAGKNITLMLLESDKGLRQPLSWLPQGELGFIHG